MPAIQASDFYLVAPKEATKQTDTADKGSADKGFTQPKAFLIGRELGRATFRASDFVKLVGHGLFYSKFLLDLFSLGIIGGHGFPFHSSVL